MTWGSRMGTNMSSTADQSLTGSSQSTGSILSWLTDAPRKRLIQLGVLLAIAALGLAFAASAVFGVHDAGLFELDVDAGPPVVGDGNTVDDAAAGDDWENVYNGDSSAFATSFIEDSFANGEIVGWEARTPEVSFFDGGGSKDTLCIQDPCEDGSGGAGGPWLYDTVNDVVPDKNDIVNAFAAAYDDPADGHTIFYFGLDTYAVQGANNVGFWFTRQQVGLNPLAPGSAQGTFFGDHSEGDIFVAAEFTQGGGVADIKVYRWDNTPGPGGKPIGPVILVTGADCATAGANDDVCGVINETVQTPVFPYLDKDGTNDYEPSAFVEFGLDINALFGDDDIGCFSSFIAETRSSQSLTAQLKDLALGSFAVCGIDVEKSGPELSKVGDDTEYSVTITNTGRATLYKQSIIDSLVGDLTDGTNADTSDCGASLAPGASCTITYTYTVQTGDPDPLLNTVDIVYTEDADGLGLSFEESSSWDVNLFQPSITLDKTGDALSKIGDDTAYAITLTNTSSADAPDLVCTVTDTAVGVNQTVTLASDADPYVIEASAAIPAGALDPYQNTASASCSPTGFPNVIDASASHDVNLFQPSITLDKTGDALSKIGDDTAYAITLTNTSSADAPDLVCTVTDTAVGVNQTVTLASDADPYVIEASAAIPAGALDPYQNTASASCSPTGFPNVIDASASHDVNLFQPSITLDKTGDALSKIGDDTAYAITLTNTSSADAPDLVCTVTDTAVGVNQTVTLASDADPYVIEASAAIPAGALDPYQNTASASCSPTGFPNVIDASASHDVNLFQPSITLDKTGDALSKIGDDTAYAITLTNTSSADAPDLVCTVTDTAVGVNQTVTLASDADPYVIEASAAIPAGALDPYQNTASASCSPTGFPNVIDASASHDVNLFQPSITLDKTGDALSKIGDDTAYAITLTNTSSADAPDLVCTVTDTAVGVNQTVTLASDADPYVIEASAAIPAGALDPYQNTASASCSPTGFPNVIDASASHDVNLFQPSITLDKTGDALSKIGDDTAYAITLTNTSSADAPDLVCTVTDTAVGVNQTVTLASDADPYVIEASAAIPAGALDPYQNTASASCSPTGFPNVIDASASHDVNLFQPSITLDKTGDALSKIGDDTAYAITLTNTSSADAPDLVCTVTDTAVGVNQTVTLASDADPYVIEASAAIPAGALDPYQNTASASCSPTGFPNVIDASASHDVNLFQPSITLDKTGDALSKIGDDTAYAITLTNTSSADAPDLVCTVTDTAVGVNQTVTLASDADPYVIEASAAIPAGALDPYQNTASASCSPTGFPNVIDASASHDVNLFQPSITLDKTVGNPYSKAGDTIDYTITLTNTSSTDAPALNCTVTDAVVGVNDTVTLASGEQLAVSVGYVVQVGDADPYVNTASATCSPDGFPNVIDTSASATVDLLHPSFTISKDCTNSPVPQEGPATWDVVISNTGDVQLDFTADDGIGTFSLAGGTSQTFPVSQPGDYSGQTSISNTVTASWVLPAEFGLDNTDTKSASATCDIGSRVDLLKLTNGVVAPTYDWQFSIYDGPNFGAGSGFLGSSLATDSTLNDVDGILDFDNLNLDPTMAYTICELNNNAAAGWTQEWMVDTTGDGVPDTTVPAYNPHESDPVMQNLGFSCADFGADTGWPLVAGETLSFSVNNQFPGGDPRTPGYWKNWSSCTNGGQYEHGTTGDPNNEFFVLDELLNDPGFLIGDLLLDQSFGTQEELCQAAVDILDHRDIVSGRKMASDAAYNLARNLLAYRLNQAAGACQSNTADQAALDGQALLDSINFDGTGKYLRPRHALYSDANTLAGLLDEYNNGLLC